MSHLKPALLGTLIGLLGLIAGLAPPLANLEVDLGLKWLFQLRGPRPAPDQVVVVTIDKASSRRFGLPNQPRDWPRSFHAELVRGLTRQGAAVIVFDVVFDRARNPAHDKQFAEAVADAGNVILFQYLRREGMELPRSGVGNDFKIDIETLVPPIPELAEAALGLAPFPLPKVPVRINQAWIFKSGAGDTPTLPIVALTALVLPRLGMLRATLGRIDPQSLASFPDFATPEHSRNRAGSLTGDLRDFLLSHPKAAGELEFQLSRAAHPASRDAPTDLPLMLVQALRGPESQFLDFYGPPHSISTLSYADVLLDESRGDLSRLAGKTVFVGFSEQLQPEQHDSFYTVFSRPDGLDVSGVEIVATTFANLVEGRSVTPLPQPWQWLLLMAWGLLLGGLLLILPIATAVPAALASVLGYLAVAQQVFSSDGTWVPLFIPVLIQVPLALLGAFLWRYLTAHRQQRKMRHVFGHYVPPELVDELAHGGLELAHKRELVFGVCLATDAEQYAGLSERLGPEELHSLLNRYYQILFAAVRRNDGIVSDVVGDAMLAIWTAGETTLEAREKACRAAWEIFLGVAVFNAEQGQFALPTRIGVHCGQMMLGNVGAGDHYEYRAVGDSVNTANRIQGLNKTLGTHILVSADTVPASARIITRPLGRFRLSGKTAQLSVHELVQIGDPPKDRGGAGDALLQSGLEAIAARNWDAAADCFQHCLELRSDDGPARFYLRLCNEYQRNPPPSNWDGVIQIEIK